MIMSHSSSNVLGINIELILVFGVDKIPRKILGESVETLFMTYLVLSSVALFRPTYYCKLAFCLGSRSTDKKLPGFLFFSGVPRKSPNRLVALLNWLNAIPFVQMALQTENIILELLMYFINSYYIASRYFLG